MVAAGNDASPATGRVGGESAGSQASAEVAVSDDAELVTALSISAQDWPASVIADAAADTVTSGAHQTMGRIWWRASRNA